MPERPPPRREDVLAGRPPATLPPSAGPVRPAVMEPTALDRQRTREEDELCRRVEVVVHGLVKRLELAAQVPRDSVEQLVLVSNLLKLHDRALQNVDPELLKASIDVLEWDRALASTPVPRPSGYRPLPSEVYIRLARGDPRPSRAGPPARASLPPEGRGLPGPLPPGLPPSNGHPDRMGPRDAKRRKTDGSPQEHADPWSLEALSA